MENEVIRQKFRDTPLFVRPGSVDLAWISSSESAVWIVLLFEIWNEIHGERVGVVSTSYVVNIFIRRSRSANARMLRYCYMMKRECRCTQEKHTWGRLGIFWRCPKRQVCWKGIKSSGESTSCKVPSPPEKTTTKDSASASFSREHWSQALVGI